jgi:hypothetical protein
MLTTRPLASFALLVAVVLAACSSAAGPIASAPAATPAPTPTEVPGDPGGGGSSGGIVTPIPGDPDSNPLFGKATYVTPGRGLIDVHPVDVQLVRAIVNDDGSTTVDLRWWSGVAPCTQLSAVQVARDDTTKTVRLTVTEGSGGGQVACIDIAQLTATQVQLAGLASGAWRISAEGDAPAITLDVP